LSSNLNSSGDLPKEFYSTSFDDYLQQRNQIDINKTRKERLPENQFYLETNYWLYDLQFSGKILYGGVIGKYVDQVVDSLLAGNEEIRKNIHVYIIKSSSLNAFTTHQGNIYVNLGLLARVRTEAELAYILSHEIEHYLRKHVLKGFMFSKTPESKNETFNSKPIYEDSIIRIHNYSQAMEFEADTLGFHLFEKSKYNLQGAQSVFQLLEKANEPVFNSPINIEGLNLYGDRLKFPDSLFQVNLHDTLQDEKHSTHPVVQERGKVISRLIMKHTSRDRGRDYLQPQSKLDNIRELAQYELCKTLIQDESFVEAVYYTSVMQKKYPESEYFTKWFCKSLTAFSIIRNKDAKMQGEMFSAEAEVSKFQKCMFFLSPKEVLAVAISKNWQAHEKYKDNEDILFCLKAALRTFKAKYNDEYGSIVQGKYKEDSTQVSNLVSSTFSRLLEISAFKEAAAQVENVETVTSQTNFDLLTFKSIPKGNTLILPSVNIILDFRQPAVFDFMESEKENIRIDNKIQKMCGSDHARIKLLSPYIKSHMSVEEYNDMSVGRDVIDDMMFYGNGFTTTDLSQIKMLKERNNSKYLMWSATVTGIDHADIDPQLKVMLPFVFFPSLGYFAWKEISGRSETYNFSFLLDMDNMTYYLPSYHMAKNLAHSKVAMDQTNLFLSKIKRR
jgi:hypothetical protein